VPDTLSRVLDVLERELDIERDKIGQDDRFGDEIEADSLDIVQVVMGLEAEFDIEIPDVDAEKLTTVHKIVDYVDTYNVMDMRARRTADTLERWG